MIEILNGFGGWLVGHLWQMSVELTILAAVVLAALCVLRIKSPALRHLFWCLVLAKPVATFLIASPISLYSFLRPPVIQPLPVPVVQRTVAYRPPMTDRPMMQSRYRPAMAPVDVPPAPRAWKLLDRYGVVAILWTASATAFALRLVVGCAYVAFIRRTAVRHAEGFLPGLVGEVSALFGTGRRVRVATSSVVDGPVLAGIVRPVILVPERLTGELSVHQMRMIIAHEIAHVRRHDNLILLIQRLAEMLLFFHPVVWLCGRIMRRVGRMTAGLTIISIIALIALACVGLPTASERKSRSDKQDKGHSMTKKESTTKPTVKREGSKVWIEGGDSFDNFDESLSHLRAIACVLTSYSEQVDWDWLMGTSGEAFCYYYHPDGTFLSQYVHSWDVANAALGAYGHAGQWRSELSDDVTPALMAIESELSEGRLVIAPGIMPAADGIHSRCNQWFVVNGIDRDTKKVTVLGAGKEELETPLPIGDSPKPGPHPRWYGIIRSFQGIDGHYGPARADNPVLLVDRMNEPVRQKEIILRALGRAVSLAREGSTVSRFGWGAGTYLAGHAAMQRLHDDLLAGKGDGLEEYRKLNKPKGDPFGGLGDELPFLQLLGQRRQSAARFLTQAAALLSEAAQRHLASAVPNWTRFFGKARLAMSTRRGWPIGEQPTKPSPSEPIARQWPITLPA